MRSRQTRRAHVVVMVLAPESDDSLLCPGLLWSSLTWSVVPESDDNERRLSPDSCEDLVSSRENKGPNDTQRHLLLTNSNVAN
ncbi:hypothetical protein F2P81_003364 [Scophthalmus maximus]|uniref:Uncharacterized protein n=1 Tax=Scophthalmus maximus TaxID=52904 RepID=A0A6A4T9F8_SCOMX|nr:hypothetical protein F2P81_003364 [Scophthalmus maximus]